MKKDKGLSPETLLKRDAAQAAIKYINDWNMVVGVGSGSTVNCFIDALACVQNRIDVCVASSVETENRLKAHGIRVERLTEVGTIDVYIDGADEINHQLQMIKGGGGALTREKIVASAAKQFVCIAHATKYVDLLGTFPLAIEVIPMARSLIARKLVTLGGTPEYREGFITDNGNVILDVYGLDLSDTVGMEKMLNNMPGIVCHGLFATHPADILLLASDAGIETITRP